MMGTVGVAPGTTTFTLADGTVIALADWRDDRFYSTVQTTNGSTAPIEAFSSGRSAQIAGGQRTASRVDTNIPRAGSNGLPNAYEMLIFSIGIQVVRIMRVPTGGSSPVLADGSGALSDPPQLGTLFGINRVTYCEFAYQDKAYSQGVMTDFPQGTGFSLFTTRSDVEIAQNGVPSPRDRNALVLPIHMKENNSYKLLFQPEAALVIAQAASDGGAVLPFADIKATLWGLIKVPVI